MNKRYPGMCVHCNCREPAPNRSRCERCMVLERDRYFARPMKQTRRATEFRNRHDTEVDRMAAAGW